MKQSQNVHREKSLLRLVRCYPLASVLVLWVTLLLLAGVSTAALMNVNNSEDAKIAQIPSAEPSNSAITEFSKAQDPKQSLPWLAFGAIAISCTLGCLFLSQTFRAAGYQPVQRKTSKARKSTLSQLAKTDDQDSLDSPDQSQPDSSFNIPLVTSVSVVPKQQNHPLDWDEPSLADSLDMRQRRPLSHWL